MYQLGDVARSVASLAFGLVGVWMAHTFYRSPRSRTQVWIAWLLGFGYCTVAAWLIEYVVGFSPSSHEHLSDLIGFGAIFVYLYLFTEIPVAQRIFTYFFIDNSMYILVLLSRLAALLLSGLLPLSHDALFLTLFTLLTAGYLFLFERRLKTMILRALSAFQNQLPVLTVYACVSYLAMLALIDPWAPLERPSAEKAFALLLLCCAASCGYLLAFSLMHAVRRAQAADLESRQLSAQLALSQQYYRALVDSIEQERELRHDFSHHLRVLKLMLAQSRFDDLGKYLSGLIGHGEATPPARYCACYAANVLLDHYSRQAQEHGIAFCCDAAIPEWEAEESAQLCIVLGNLLQNALEGCLRLHEEQPREISLLARVVNDNLTIEVTNSFDGILTQEDGKILTRKKEQGHGLGLSSVAGVAESRHGFFCTSHDDKQFTARVVLRLPERLFTQC